MMVRKYYSGTGESLAFDEGTHSFWTKQCSEISRLFITPWTTGKRTVLSLNANPFIESKGQPLIEPVVPELCSVI